MVQVATFTRRIVKICPTFGSGQLRKSRPLFFLFSYSSHSCQLAAAAAKVVETTEPTDTRTKRKGKKQTHFNVSVECVWLLRASSPSLIPGCFPTTRTFQVVIAASTLIAEPHRFVQQQQHQQLCLSFVGQLSSEHQLIAAELFHSSGESRNFHIDRSQEEILQNSLFGCSA